MKKIKTYKQKYKEMKFWRNYFIILFVVVFIFLIGLILNKVAIKSNQNRMPVFKSNIDTIFHFGYWDNSEINNSFLTDWIVIGEKGIFSIGDILMIMGIFILSYYEYTITLKLFKIKWKKKN